MYYDTCSAVDRHKQIINDDLKLYKKLSTHNWTSLIQIQLHSIQELLDKECRKEAFSQRITGEGATYRKV